MRMMTETAMMGVVVVATSLEQDGNRSNLLMAGYCLLGSRSLSFLL